MKRVQREVAGVSLIELLAVITIIALLGGIVFAAFGPVRERSRQVACLSNLYQLHTAMSLYQQDFDGDDVKEGERPLCDKVGLPCSTESYSSFLKDYVKNQTLLICPSYQGSDVRIRKCTYSPILLSVPAVLKMEQDAIYRLGQKTPQFMCEDDFHDPPTDWANAPRWQRRHVLLIRFNGQGKTVMAGRDDTFPFE